MIKRIIKETLHNGKEQYLVQSNSIPFIEALWTTDTVTMISDNGNEVYADAVFNSLEEAQRFCGLKPDAERVIKREIIAYNQYESKL